MRWARRAIGFALILWGLTTVARAEVVVTDCAADPHLSIAIGATVLDAGGDDLTVRCALSPKPGTERVILRGRAIRIAGPEGSVYSSGRGRTIQMIGTAVALENTTIEADRGNASVRLSAGDGGFRVRNSLVTVGGAEGGSGRELRFECLAGACPLELHRSDLRSHYIRLLATGTISATQSTITTRGPRDKILVASAAGDVSLGGCGVALRANLEGRVQIAGAGNVDLSGAQVGAGRWITVLAANGRVSLRGATLRNDYGKRGDIEISAAEDTGTVDIDGATIVDDDRRVRVNDVAKINGRESTPRGQSGTVIGSPALDS